MRIDLTDYARWDATDMARLVRGGEVTSDALLEACLTLVERRDPAVNAVADLADPPPGPSGDPSAPFAGVPYAVKELLAWPGLPWAMGSRLLAANPAPARSPYADRLHEAGLRVAFSTTSSEMGLLGSTESLLRGVTANPWRPGWSAGGSSGGAAAAVAAGLLPMAHATDGGGSVRLPAALHGLFGFMPSSGRCAPAMPQDTLLASLVADHAVSRTVRDSAALLAATERTDASAPYAPVGHVTGPSRQRLTVGVLTDTLLGAPPERAVADVLDEAAGLCASLGHEVVVLGPLDVDGRAVSDMFFTAAALAMAETAAMVEPLLGRPPGPEELEPFTLALVAQAASLPPGTAESLEETRRREAAAYRRVFRHCDVVLSPTLATTGWPVGHLAPDVGRDELVRRTEAAVGYTPVHNVAGCPAMSVPLGWPGGVPVGVHAAAPPGADATLLRLAYALEEAAPWAHRRPDVTRLEAAA